MGAKFTEFVKANRALAAVLAALLGFLAFHYADAGKVSDIKKRVRKVFTAQPAALSASAREVRDSIFYSPLETVILNGPSHNGYVENTRVEFALDGWQLVPFQKTGEFEVWLIGFDAVWKNTGARVVYDLAPGKRTYTLLARAKNRAGEHDTTPVVRTFTVNVSPYFGQIKISNVVYRGEWARPHYEKISINNNSADVPVNPALARKSGVNVTGWKILTKKFNFSFEIPRAAALLNPRNPANSDAIILARGGGVDFFTGKPSPVGANFQENACTSYLNAGFESYDALSGYGNCTLPEPASYSRFSIDCRLFVRGLTSCRNPELAYYQFINEPSCRDFIIKNFNYSVCVERARANSDFYSGRWRVYLGRNEEILEDLNDTIYLYDAQGLLVDVYSY